MLKLFQYNWQVRDEWLDWCRDVPVEELFKQRTGGVGSIYLTLLHIIEVEKSWVHDIKGEVIPEISLDDFTSLNDLKIYSDKAREATEEVVRDYQPEKDYLPIQCPESDGSFSVFTYGEILRHLIAHEIHHVGQLSVWAREIGKAPITANLIRRGLFEEV